MRTATTLAACAFAVGLAACQQKIAAPPPPQSLTPEAMAHFCGMNVLEHPGPKGQILLSSHPDPVWFVSARDTLAFTMLPDEPKDIRAIYVSDMAKATDWSKPGADNWVDAHKAWFVIGSDARGGMGAQETVPFSDERAAKEFIGRHGGKAVRFADVPKSAVLTQTGEAPSSGAAPANIPGGR